MAEVAYDLKILVGNDCEKVKTGSKLTTEISSGIAHIGKDKQETLQLQGELWKNLARVEKELCRMRKLGDIATEDYKSQLTEKMQNLCLTLIVPRNNES